MKAITVHQREAELAENKTLRVVAKNAKNGEVARKDPALQLVCRYGEEHSDFF